MMNSMSNPPPCRSRIGLVVIAAVISYARSLSFADTVHSKLQSVRDPNSGPSAAAPAPCGRRAFLVGVAATFTGATAVIGFGESAVAVAEEDDDDGEGGAAAEPYENPNIPAGPEERSGLVVLRVAEVAQFQEKILRAVANGGIDVVVTPQQIVFGTQILLRNSNIAGNMQLMIDTEVPRKSRNEARRNAVVAMNTLQSISTTAAKIQRPFTNDEMIEVADLYRSVRLQLNSMYEYLPPKEKEKYYGYFMAVTEYEKKIAEGVYNPDLDGVLEFDY